MAAVTPLPAASVIVLRDAPLEVLMLRRSPNSSFMPDVWVFPGGRVEPIDEDMSDGTTLTTMRLAGVRETFEESGLTLNDLEKLVWTSRWITPEGVPKRFDTYFFLAEVERDQVARVDGIELTEARWVAPQRALEELKLAFPTARNLEALLGFDTARELLESRKGAVIEPVQPILVNGKPTLP